MAEITDSNQEMPRDRLVSDSYLLQRIAADVAAVRADMAQLRQAWAEYEPVVSAFRRGGVLAARSARRGMLPGRAPGRVV